MTDFTLIIGNKNFSSWSLRAWLALKATGAAFHEVKIPLRTPETKKLALHHSPSGMVPTLKMGTQVVWDSLAIGETLAELFPDARLLPADSHARAFARSVCAEMHSGFTPLRSQHPMDMTARMPVISLSPEVAANAERIEHIWRDARTLAGRGKGDFLLGKFGLVDAFYAPVVSRFVTYGVPVSSASRDYMDAVWNHPDFAAWVSDAEQEVAASHA